jgi:hypothetical protein
VGYTQKEYLVADPWEGEIIIASKDLYKYASLNIKFKSEARFFVIKRGREPAPLFTQFSK